MNSADDIDPIEYIGTAISHFQSEPVMNMQNNSGSSGTTQSTQTDTLKEPLTDWEFELQKNLQGKKSCIKRPQHIEDFPHFLPLKETYIKRGAELGQNMFCFSLDFGRLCPKPFEFNTELMTEYVKVMALCKKYNQEPYLTINHFTMPKFLLTIDKKERIVKGAWENPFVLDHFTFYVKKVVAFLKDEENIKNILRKEGYDQATIDAYMSEGLVKYIVSINEPAVVALLGYITGTFPPFKKWRFIKAQKVLKTMVKAHDIVRSEFRALNATRIVDRKMEVGIGYTWQYFDGLLGGVARALSMYSTNIFERCGNHSDFIGIHYYFRRSSLFSNRHAKNRDYGDQPSFGDIFPHGITKILTMINKSYPNKDIFVSEVGFADTKGARRPYWLGHTIKHVIQARESGLPIKGLLVWSIADNFEWDLGMNIAKFGLFSEKQLSEPLHAEDPNIHSWQLFKQAAKAIKHPSMENLADLEEDYEKAKHRYYNEIKSEKEAEKNLKNK